MMSDIVKKIKDLEVKLEETCARKNARMAGGFTIMFNNEDGRTILYARDMDIELTGISRCYYDKSSDYFDPKYKEINWPFTGFVKGNVAGWTPIAIAEIANWLIKYDYSVDRYIHGFNPPKLYY